MGSKIMSQEWLSPMGHNDICQEKLDRDAQLEYEQLGFAAQRVAHGAHGAFSIDLQASGQANFSVHDISGENCASEHS